MDLIDPTVLVAFTVTSTLIELTPGPNMVYLALVAASHGRRLAFATVLGVALGLSIVGLGAALGLAAAINASPAAYQLLRVAGVGYLLWLAWCAWREADGPISKVPKAQSRQIYFQRGLITNLLNPKAAIFYIAVLPGFVDPSTNVVPQTVILSMTFVAVATAIHGVIVLLAGAAHTLLKDEARSRFIRRVLALGLAGVAFWFAWKSAA